MTRTGRPLAMPADERKKEIFAAAEKLFGERGYDNVTMAEIGAEAGMSKKTLYVHFADKRELLQSLVTSSYIWPEDPVEGDPADSVQGLAIRLKKIADHVLSTRHLKLCRLAIGESISSAGLGDTFYRMGIAASRQSLIAAIDRIEPLRRAVSLNGPVMADMLFGAAIGKVLIDALLTAERPDMSAIYACIDDVIATLFTTDTAR